MSFDEKKLVQDLLTSSVATYYTVPASTKAIVKHITICNITAVDKTVEVWLVPSGNSAANTNILIASATVLANGILCWDGFVPIEAGDTIQAKASANTALTMTAGGAIIT